MNFPVQATTAFLLAVTAVLLAACTVSGGANVSALLAQDYRQMPDARLTAYEQELSDAMVRAAGTGAGGVSLGFGFGSWGSGGGVGVGVDQALGGSGADGSLAELRERREAVRAEMRKRSLLPGAGGT